VRARAPTHLAASTRDRLVGCSRKIGEDFQFLIQRYATESFLNRLCESNYRLMGAMPLLLWRALADGRTFCGTWVPPGPRTAP
jgi:hypothetical protein